MTKRFWKISLLAGCVIAAMSSAHAEIQVFEKDGYTFSVDGWVILNASSTRGDTAMSDAFRITSGDSPNNFGFNVGVPEIDGIKTHARLGLRVNPHSGAGNFKNNGNVGSTASTSIDPREFWASFTSSAGQLVVGKQYSLYQGRSVLADASVLAGGFFAYDNANTGAAMAAGSLHSGYLYANFNSGLRYNTPQTNPLKASIAIYDPSEMRNVFVASAPLASKTETPRFEAEISYDGKLSNGSYLLYMDGVTQEAKDCKVGAAVCAAGDSVKGTGMSAGASLNIGNVGLFVSGFNAKGLGSVLQYDTDSLDAVGNERKSKGYWLQGTLNATPALLLRASYGETRVDSTTATLGHIAKGTMFGGYYTFNKFTTIYGELGRSVFDHNPAAGNVATSTDYLNAGVRFMW